MILYSVYCFRENYEGRNGSFGFCPYSWSSDDCSLWFHLWTFTIYEQGLYAPTQCDRRCWRSYNVDLLVLSSRTPIHVKYQDFTDLMREHICKCSNPNVVLTELQMFLHHHESIVYFDSYTYTTSCWGKDKNIKCIFIYKWKWCTT